MLSLIWLMMLIVDLSMKRRNTSQGADGRVIPQALINIWRGGWGDGRLFANVTYRNTSMEHLCLTKFKCSMCKYQT